MPSSRLAAGLPHLRGGGGRLIAPRVLSGRGSRMVTAQRLARSIVRDSLRPKEYEPVIVSTYPHTTELAEEIALECQKLGADPFLVLDTDRVFYGQFKNF